MDIREWWGTPSAVWGVLVVGIGGGTVIALVPLPIGICIGIVLFIIGILLILRAYRHRDKRLDEPRAKCKKGDHSWFNDKSLEGVAYRCEAIEHEHDDFGGNRTEHLRKTCYFCKHSEDTTIF